MARTKWTRWCLLLCGAGFLLSAPAFAQRYLTLEEYRGLIEEAQRRPLGALGRELARYRPESLGLVVADFLREPPPAAAIKRAALLHTEAALGLGSGGEAHLALATKLNLAIPDPASRESWLRRWSLAVAYSYHHAINPLAAERFLDSALGLLPGDRDLQVALARVLHMGGRLRGEERLTARAGDVLRDVLRETPDDAELRVRLASILGRLGREEEAAAELARLEGARMRPLLRAVVHLVRGETALNNGDFVAAEHEFVGALRRARTSPAAASGLIAARMALRDHVGAAEAAKTLLDRRAVGWEPEWQFWLGPARDLDEAFESLRAEAQGRSTEGEPP